MKKLWLCKKSKDCKDNCVVVSMLNFSHILSKVDLENIINKYLISIGKFILLIDTYMLILKI